MQIGDRTQLLYDVPLIDFTLHAGAVGTITDCGERRAWVQFAMIDRPILIPLNLLQMVTEDYPRPWPRPHETKLTPRGLALRENGPWVYLLRDEDGFYKIGYTTNLDERIKAIARQRGIGVKLVHKIATENADRIERYLHRVYTRQRVKSMGREWFDLKPIHVNQILVFDPDSIMRQRLSDQEESE